MAEAVEPVGLLFRRSGEHGPAMLALPALPWHACQQAYWADTPGPWHSGIALAVPWIVCFRSLVDQGALFTDKCCRMPLRRRQQRPGSLGDVG